MTTRTDWATELAHTWPLLPDPLPARISSFVVHALPTGGDVRVAIDDRGARHLLVPVRDEELHLTPEEGALTVRVRPYTFQGSTQLYIDVACTRTDLQSTFDDVLVDVLGQVESATAPAAATVTAVARWRELLATRRASRLVLTQQMSLFAELTVLDLLTPDADIDARWWRGPRREPHDIVTPTHALEVKAAGAMSTSVTVHGLEQLEPPGRPLALVVVEVVEDGDGRSLPELVDDVIARTADRGELLWLLAAAGFDRSDAGAYPEKFSVEDIGYAEVTEAMPRIVPSSFGVGGVPLGLGRVVYQLDLDVLAPLLTHGETALSAWAGDR